MIPNSGNTHSDLGLQIPLLRHFSLFKYAQEKNLKSPVANHNYILFPESPAVRADHSWQVSAEFPAWVLP